MNPNVDFYFDKAGKWENEIRALRKTILSCQLQEELKWGTPCYTLDGRNIVLIHIFKEYCAVLFFKGVALQDAQKLLIQQTENVQTARQMRFTSLSEIKKTTTALKAYIFEAIEVEKSGVKMPLKKTKEFSMAEEFKSALNKSTKLKKAFEALTPGRQRAYLLHFSSAKQSATRIARIEKYVPKILAGKGIDD
ncbi:MAG TPA: YdeI/OmpD-associated family protein [Chitinophagales bacterium]|nr:YdeI/OmpD-associated family protein [Chitinophagales bacterium]HNA57627.1 YdeI/OmpD-associated family protein [Chitinophagales bacterium]HNE44901.1 YdeI/OmpD-associated family protein [Chitinophagales bacterium]HNF69294.1 YdeI/OmpD-associated family protein [Chitinophagales bacterium]HNJ90480.1 YdeI/OmpD-associated family protein [Chitinophagales bacterium]